MQIRAGGLHFGRALVNVHRFVGKKGRGFLSVILACGCAFRAPALVFCHRDCAFAFPFPLVSPFYGLFPLWVVFSLFRTGVPV